MPKDKLILLDAGHGGLIEGKYTTYPYKRVDYGTYQINEGVLNRAFVYLISYLLDLNKIPNEVISENTDTSLDDRVKRINDRTTLYDCLLISVHHNYFNDPDVKGIELFTSRGETESDYYAEELCKMFLSEYPHRKFRKHSVSKLSKEANFYIITKTKCPAVLLELGFMQNDEDARYMTSPIWISLLAKSITNKLIELYDQI